MNDKDFQIRFYSPKELAGVYQCSAKTFRKWTRKLDAEIGPRVGNLYSPRQVRIIVERLGEP